MGASKTGDFAEQFLVKLRTPFSRRALLQAPNVNVACGNTNCQATGVAPGTDDDDEVPFLVALIIVSIALSCPHLRRNLLLRRLGLQVWKVCRPHRRWPSILGLLLLLLRVLWPCRGFRLRLLLVLSPPWVSSVEDVAYEWISPLLSTKSKRMQLPFIFVELPAGLCPLPIIHHLPLLSHPLAPLSFPL